MLVSRKQFFIGGVGLNAQIEHYEEDEGGDYDVLSRTTIHDGMYTFYINWHNREGREARPIVHVRLWPRKFKEMVNNNDEVYLLLDYHFTWSSEVNGAPMAVLSLIKRRVNGYDGAFITYLEGDTIGMRLSIGLASLKWARKFTREFYGIVSEEGQDLIDLAIEANQGEGVELTW